MPCEIQFRNMGYYRSEKYSSLFTLHSLLLFLRSMLLIIDNYDSFTYNLLQYFGELGADPIVRHHDQISLEEIAVLKPERLCISEEARQVFEKQLLKFLF